MKERNTTHPPLVSVIMPVYNAELFVGKAIRSILSQTFSNFELIILNDGSTDRSQQVIDSFTDSRIVKIKNSHKGVAETMNMGLTMAKGKFILRHDADDMSLPTKLQKQVNCLVENNELDFISTQIVYMTENGRIAHGMYHPPNEYFLGHKWRFVTYEDIIHNRSIVYATMLVKKNKILELNGYRTWFKTSEDLDLILRMLDKYKLAVLGEPLYMVRLSTSSICYRNFFTLGYYMDTALDLSEERRKHGYDRLDIGEIIDTSLYKTKLPKEKGVIYRKDLFFLYKVALKAMDWSAAIRIAFSILRSGWRLKKTWLNIIQPFRK